MKSMRSLYKKLFHYVQDKRIWAYFSMALSAAAVCSYMGAYWFLWQSIVSILVIPVYEKAMYDAIIVVILMILRGILNIASATCSHYLGFRLETNLRKTGLHKLLDASSSFFDHNSSGEIRKIIDDNAAETHKTVAHLIPDNVTAVMTPVLMFVLMFAILYKVGVVIDPVTRFFGLKWQAFLAFCASAISKESLLGVLNTLYGAGGSLVSSIFGAKVSAAAAGGISEILAANFTKAEGLAFIFAISFNMPCVSALAATAREAHSVRWTAKIGVFYTLASLLIACIVYHIGVLLF